MQPNTSLYPRLEKTVARARQLVVPEARKSVLDPLIAYIQDKVDRAEIARLNFICTHNSRRSQLSQVWAQTAAAYFGIPAQCYSGGVEVTAFNERAIAALQRSGFRVVPTAGTNPMVEVFHSEGGHQPVRAFSKLFDDPENGSGPFAAVMTCSHADENCPFIPGAEIRIPVRYEDPKEFDGLPQEAAKYDERSLQIASELFYVFSKIRMT